MAIHIDIDEQDESELSRIRKELTRLRNEAGLSQRQVAILARRSDKWMNELEGGIGHPHISSLQQWAGMFDLRIEPVFYNLTMWQPDDIPPDCLLTWKLSYQMSRPFDAHAWCRAFLMAELVAYRHAEKVSAAQLSRRLGLSVSAVSGWERDGNDPLVSKVFTYVRALGGWVRFELVGRDCWAHR